MASGRRGLRGLGPKWPRPDMALGRHGLRPMWPEAEVALLQNSRVLLVVSFLQSCPELACRLPGQILLIHAPCRTSHFPHSSPDRLVSSLPAALGAQIRLINAPCRILAFSVSVPWQNCPRLACTLPGCLLVSLVLRFLRFFKFFVGFLGF